MAKKTNKYTSHDIQNECNITDGKIESMSITVSVEGLLLTDHHRSVQLRFVCFHSYLMLRHSTDHDNQ